MKPVSTLILATIALTAPVAAHALSSENRATGVETALIDATARKQGAVSITPEGDITRISVNATGLTPGAHGMHLHAVGKCDTPDFTSSGGHWIPEHKQHGHANPMGPHKGDLPQLMADGAGVGKTEFTVDAKIANMIDQDGVALVIHANADDDKTDPSGNSGGRQLCAAFNP